MLFSVIPYQKKPSNWAFLYKILYDTSCTRRKLYVRAINSFKKVCVLPINFFPNLVCIRKIVGASQVGTRLTHFCFLYGIVVDINRPTIYLVGHNHRRFSLVLHRLEDSCLKTNHFHLLLRAMLSFFFFLFYRGVEFEYCFMCS